MRNDLKFGLIGGGISIAWTLLMWVLGLHQGNLIPGMILGYIGWIFYIAIVFFAIRETRNKELDGFISYGKAWWVGTLSGIITSVISTLFSYIYMTVLNPAYTLAVKTFSIDKTVEYMQKQNIPESKISETVEKMSQSTAGLGQYIQAFIIMAILISLITLIVAAILQKKKIEEIKQV